MTSASKRNSRARPDAEHDPDRRRRSRPAPSARSDGAPLRLRRPRSPRAATRRCRGSTAPTGARIDLLILDLVMPDLDGLGVLRADARGRPRRPGDRPDRARRRSTPWFPRCAPARPISSSSRSAPSGCRSRSRTRSRSSALEDELRRIAPARAGHARPSATSSPAAPT